MSYILKEVVLRTNNTPKGMEKFLNFGEIYSLKKSLCSQKIKMNY